MTHAFTLPFRKPALFFGSTSDDGLTSRERKRRARRYLDTAGRKSTTEQLDSLEARMKAREGEDTPD